MHPLIALMTPKLEWQQWVYWTRNSDTNVYFQCQSGQAVINSERNYLMDTNCYSLNKIKKIKKLRTVTKLRKILR